MKTHWWNPGADLLGAAASVAIGIYFAKRAAFSWSDAAALFLLFMFFCMNVNDAIEHTKNRWNKN